MYFSLNSQKNQIDTFKYLPFTILIKIDKTNIDQHNMTNFKQLFENVQKFINSAGSKYSDLFQIVNITFS
jgi:hypothetical protein